MPNRTYNNGSSDPVKEKFTGKERDWETGWDYFGARYYDPSIARWLAVDPLSDTAPSLTPYHYCSNNPINRIDPTGMKDGDDEEEEEESDLWDIFIGAITDYFVPNDKGDLDPEQQAEEAESKSEVQNMVEDAGKDIAEAADKSLGYITISVDKQTTNLPFQGSITFTSDGGVGITGGVDGTLGVGAPIGISGGVLRRTDGQRPTIDDISGGGVGATGGLGMGLEYISNTNGSVYGVGIVVSPAVWVGGNSGSTITFKK